MKWVERQRYFVDFTLSSLGRRKGKNASLLLVYTLIVFLVSSVMFFSSALRKEALTLLDEAPEMIVQRTLAGRHELVPLRYAKEIRGIRGVRSVEARLWGYYYHPASRSNYTVMAREPFEHGDDEAVVGDGVLRTWGTSSGNQLTLRSHSGEAIVLKIAETFSASSDLVASDLILISETAFRRLTGLPEDFATDLVVVVRNPAECQTIAEKINRMLPDTRPILREEILRTYASLFDWRSGYVIVLLSGAVLAFFIFAWDKATGLSAEERAEIGILKALGWDTSDILGMKFWEGCVVSLIGFLAGTILAYLHVFFAPAPLFAHALKGWAILYPTFELNPSVDLYQIGILFFLTVFPYAFVTMIPAWRVAITDPDEVMR